MGKECVSKARTLGCALDQARDVGHDDLAIIGLDSA
jgi:hypothetical protein